MLPERERLEHLGHRLDHAIDLGGADSHAAGVERRVAASVDDHAAVHGPRREVAVRPHLGEPFEVRGVVALARLVAPEAERHRRERLPADQLAGDTGRLAQRRSVVGRDVDGHAEHRSLDLARVHRSGRIATHQAAAQVGAAGDRREVHVGLDPLVDHAEPVG